MDAIWEYIKLIPLFVYKWANFAIQWVAEKARPLISEFQSQYNSDSITLIGCAVIMVLALVCWILIFRKAMNDDDDDEEYLHGAKKVMGFISLFLYAFVLIWITAMLTHPLNDAGSFLLNAVFEQEAFKSFAEGTFMMPKLPDNSTITLSNFLYWHDLLAIGMVFVMCRFAITTVASVVTFRLFKLIQFIILTLSFIIVGVICGKLLTFLGEAGSENIFVGLITMPCFMIAYFVPMLVVWFPVAIIYGGPVVFVLGLIINILHPAPFYGPTYEYAGRIEETVIQTDGGFGDGTIHTVRVFDSSGMMTSVFSFIGGMP